MQYIDKKDQLAKFANAENINQDKTVVELREKLRLSEMRQKEMEATFTELKKSYKDNKEKSNRMSNRDS